jgi:hypothetical protein
VVKQHNADAHFHALDRADLPLRHGHHQQPPDGQGMDGTQIVQIEGFDYDEIDRRLGFTEPESNRDRSFHKAADLLETLAVWIAESATVHSAGLRGLALAWMLRPRAFDDRSATAIARRMGTTKQSILKYVSELHRLSHGIFIGPQMRPPENRRERSKITVAYHRRAGHKLHKLRK